MKRRDSYLGGSTVITPRSGWMTFNKKDNFGGATVTDLEQRALDLYLQKLYRDRFPNAKDANQNADAEFQKLEITEHRLEEVAFLLRHGYHATKTTGQRPSKRERYIHRKFEDLSRRYQRRLKSD